LAIAGRDRSIPRWMRLWRANVRRPR
jgi:hypothetical protein